MQVVLASNNAGKIKEFHELLKPLSITLIPQSELQISEAAETAKTFIENALIKARHASRLTGLPTIADDSGLVVAALQGAPGIYSARYAGEKADAKANIHKLLNELKNVPSNHRQAFFYCIIVFILHTDDPVPLICEGKWQGKILNAPQGENGFGYDPIFYVPQENKTAAELSSALKNKMSHRGKASQLLIDKLTEKLHAVGENL